MATSFSLEIKINLNEQFNDSLHFCSGLLRSLVSGGNINLAKMSQKEGHLDKGELSMISSLLANYQASVQKIVTPRTVVFSMSSKALVQDYFSMHTESQFSRIPIYDEKPEYLVGFVLRTDLLLAMAQGSEV